MVVKGDDDRKPRPSQDDGTRSVDDSPACVTVTPLGSPVVPDVYKMSATSSAAGPGSRSVPSSEKSPAQLSAPSPLTDATSPTADPDPDAGAASASLHKRAAGAACRTIRSSSPGPRRA